MNIAITLTDAQTAGAIAGALCIVLTAEQVAAVKAANATTPPIVTPPPPPPPGQGAFTINVAGVTVTLRPTGFTVQDGSATAFTDALSGKRFLGNPGATGCAVLPVQVGPNTRYAEFSEYLGTTTQHMVYASKTRGDLSSATLVSGGPGGQFSPKWKDGETWYLMFTNYVADARGNPSRAYPGGQMMVIVH